MCPEREREEGERGRKGKVVTSDKRETKEVMW